jgi:hypothetical protein
MYETIVEGIKQAMASGQSLQQAMESFYYAGYPKEEIEKAGRFILGNGTPEAEKITSPVKQLPKQPDKPVSQAAPLKEEKKTISNVSPQEVSSSDLMAKTNLPKQTLIPGKPVQKVSEYGSASSDNKTNFSKVNQKVSSYSSNSSSKASSPTKEEKKNTEEYKRLNTRPGIDWLLILLILGLLVSLSLLVYILFKDTFLSLFG